ncbi:MAG: 4-hydroxybenzoyl-CoA reductase subunit beta, partial [Deltaproteobacteria bacterium]|nr:4-hydroxybenzoyl-CoA reductase subunit beta [Deltaproteobacteria bacterium]
MLPLPRFDYLHPSSLNEAVAALSEFGSDIGILAGGTDLLVNMKNGLPHPRTLMSLRDIPGLDTISETGDATVRIGAAARLSAIADSRIIADKLPALRQAAASVASRTIRNMATIGGNLCLDTRCHYYNQSRIWRASRQPCYKTGGTACHAVSGSERCHAINASDTAPVLIALGALLVIKNTAHEREVPASTFFSDNGAQHTRLKPDELLTEIRIPPPRSTTKTAFIKLGKRRGIDFADGSIALSMDAG